MRRPSSSLIFFTSALAICYDFRRTGHRKSKLQKAVIRSCICTVSASASRRYALKSSEAVADLKLMYSLTFCQIQNIHVVQTLVQRLPDVPIIVPIQPHISMHVFHPRHLKPPSRNETVTDIRAICKRWGFWTEDSSVGNAMDDKRHSGERRAHNGKTARRGIAILSHSNGSIAHGWLIKDCAEMILRNALVDPVVFCLWEGGGLAVRDDMCFRRH